MLKRPWRWGLSLFEGSSPLGWEVKQQSKLTQSSEYDPKWHPLPSCEVPPHFWHVFVYVIGLTFKGRPPPPHKHSSETDCFRRVFVGGWWSECVQGLGKTTSSFVFPLQLSSLMGTYRSMILILDHTLTTTCQDTAAPCSAFCPATEGLSSRLNPA